MRDRLVAFAPAWLPQVAHQLPIAVFPECAFAVADARAAEFVARFDDALVGGEFQRLLATGFTHFVECGEDFAGRFARAFQRRRVDGGNRVELRTDGNVMRGRLRHAHAHFRQVESGQSFVEQMPRVFDFAVTYEMDGCCGHPYRLSARCCRTADVDRWNENPAIASFRSVAQPFCNNRLSPAKHLFHPPSERVVSTYKIANRIMSANLNVPRVATVPPHKVVQVKKMAYNQSPPLCNTLKCQSIDVQARLKRDTGAGEKKQKTIKAEQGYIKRSAATQSGGRKHQP